MIKKIVTIGLGLGIGAFPAIMVMLGSPLDTSEYWLYLAMGAAGVIFGVVGVFQEPKHRVIQLAKNVAILAVLLPYGLGAMREVAMPADNPTGLPLWIVLWYQGFGLEMIVALVIGFVSTLPFIGPPVAKWLEKRRFFLFGKDTGPRQ